MAVDTVTLLTDTTASSSPGELRTTIATAAAGDTIVFQPGLSGTISLTAALGPLNIGKDLTIAGSGANLIAVSGQRATGDFTIAAGVNATLFDLAIDNGQAGIGAGIFNNGILTVQDSTLSGSLATNSPGGGGGIYNHSGGTLTVLDSTISNTATQGGAISNSGTATVRNSTLSGNSGGSYGGAIYNHSGATLTVQNSTVVGNNVSVYGGGIFNHGGTLNLANTIIAGNSAAHDPDIGGAVISQGHNLVGNGTGSTGLMNGVNGDQVGTAASPINPLLGPLQNNGGPTNTMLPGTGSPALGKGGKPAASTDQRGGAYPPAGPWDIGAVQVTGVGLGGPIQYFAVGAGAGAAPEVVVYNAATGAIVFSFFAFNPAFTGGVRVAVADVNGDGIPDIICAAGPGGGPQVEIIDGTKLSQIQSNGQIASSAIILSFFPTAATFSGGLYVAAGTSTSGQNWVVVGAGAGGGPQVTIYAASALLAAGAAGTAPTPLGSFFATAPTFTGGVTVAVGDVFGTGNLDVITGFGPGGLAQLTVYNFSGTSLLSFYTTAQTFTGGIFVSGGTPNGGPFELIAGAGAGGGPQVSVFNNAGTLLDSFFAFPQNVTGGVRVGFSASYGASNGDGAILTAAGPGSGPVVAPFDALTFQALGAFLAPFGNFTGGLFIAG
jgi:hypothetical protein